jgi:hypothetical protein
LLPTLLLTLSAFGLAACGDDASPPPPDAGSPDAGAVDAGGSDAGDLDAGPADAGDLDAGATDGGDLDAGPADDAGDLDAGATDGGDLDAGPTDAGSPDAGDRPDLGDRCDEVPAPGSTCAHLDDPYIVRCGDRYRYVRQWTDATSDACRPFATDPDGKRYADLAAAAACAGCDETCILRASTSVTLLRCGRRTGYIEFTADGCESVIETPDGIFRDVDAWNEAVPCP